MNRKEEIVFWLSKIKKDVKFEIAKNQGYEGKNKSELVLAFFCSIPRDQFFKSIEKFRFSTRSTNFLYVLEKEVAFIDDYIQTNKDTLFADYKKDRYDEEDYYNEFQYVDDIIYDKTNMIFYFTIYIVKLKDIIQTFDILTKTEEYKRINSVKIIPVRFYLKDHLLVIRTGIDVLASKMRTWLAMLDTIFDSHSLIFSETNQMALIDKLILRTSSHIYGDDTTGIETAKLGIGIDRVTDKILDLKDSDRYKKAIKEGELKYITLTAPRDVNLDECKEMDKNDDKISFLANFHSSKIHFYQFMFEEEIKNWIGKIIADCDINLSNEVQDDIDEFEE